MGLLFSDSKLTTQAWLGAIKSLRSVTFIVAEKLPITMYPIASTAGHMLGSANRLILPRKVSAINKLVLKLLTSDDCVGDYPQCSPRR